MSVLEASEIMQLIPNRYPILFMDRVDELNPGESIVVTKNVTINESFFQGHFPGNPTIRSQMAFMKRPDNHAAVVAKFWAFATKYSQSLSD